MIYAPLVMGCQFVAEIVSLCALAISIMAVAVSAWQARLAKRQVVQAERQAHAAEVQAEQALAQAECSRVRAEAAKAALDIATGQYALEQYRGEMARREVQLSYLTQINTALHGAVKRAWHFGDDSRKDLAMAAEKLDTAIASLEKCRSPYLDCT